MRTEDLLEYERKLKLETQKPSHYNRYGIECIDAIKASMSPEEFAGYLKGNVIKYIWRYRYKKEPRKDLEKARVYLNWLAEFYKDNEEILNNAE